MVFCLLTPWILSLTHFHLLWLVSDQWAGGPAGRPAKRQSAAPAAAAPAAAAVSQSATIIFIILFLLLWATWFLCGKTGHNQWHPADDWQQQLPQPAQSLTSHRYHKYVCNWLLHTAYQAVILNYSLSSSNAASMSPRYPWSCLYNLISVLKCTNACISERNVMLPFKIF